MDPSSLQTTPPPSIQQHDVDVDVDADVWDTDGFVIPSLEILDFDDQEKAVDTHDGGASKEEKIYLGPHGAPPQMKQQDQNPSNGRKQKLKQKLKEADRRNSGSGGRENKLENLRDLVGAGGAKSKTPLNMPKASTRDWLDPHCHESEFDKPNP